MGELYSNLLGTGLRNRRLYSSKLLKIPTPQYYVFYNGTKEFPDVNKYKLSDAFINPGYDGILRDVLSEEREAVMNSILYGFTEKEEREYQKMMRREAREEGLAVITPGEWSPGVL
ncbi:MAG: hypothetical protein K6A69_07580 [Lachnospiraceae bacterium]|nr:hypothetical protein [Lachnospiraceae bacterium]